MVSLQRACTTISSKAFMNEMPSSTLPLPLAHASIFGMHGRPLLGSGFFRWLISSGRALSATTVCFSMPGSPLISMAAISSFSISMPPASYST
ncbi:hypothetical protein D3C86_2007420 [compost metagenome]